MNIAFLLWAMTRLSVNGLVSVLIWPMSEAQDPLRRKTCLFLSVSLYHFVSFFSFSLSSLFLSFSLFLSLSFSFSLCVYLSTDTEYDDCVVFTHLNISLSFCVPHILNLSMCISVDTVVEVK